MKAGNLPLKKHINEILTGERHPTRAALKRLGNIEDESLQDLQKMWPKTDILRKRRILTTLLELSQKDLFLDFSQIFYFCLEDNDAGVRETALAGISDEEDERLSARFASLLTEDKSIGVRVQAAKALGRLAMLSEYGKLNQKNTDVIYEALFKSVEDQHESVKVRREALQAIAPMSMPRVKGLIEAAYHSDKKELRLGAIYAMGLNCNRMWLTVLAEEIGSEDEDQRLAAVRALGELGEEDAALYLIEVLDDDNALIQEEAIHALGQIGGVEAREMLESLMESPQECLRSIAGEALEEIDLCEDQQFYSF